MKTLPGWWTGMQLNIQAKRLEPGTPGGQEQPRTRIFTSRPENPATLLRAVPDIVNEYAEKSAS